METILIFKAENKGTIEETLNKEPYDRQSSQIKEPKLLGFEEKDSLYLYLKGQDDILKDLIKELGDLAEEAKNRKDVLDKLHEEEASVNAGVGFVFGE